MVNDEAALRSRLSALSGEQLALVETALDGGWQPPLPPPGPYSSALYLCCDPCGWREEVPQSVFDLGSEGLKMYVRIRLSRHVEERHPEEFDLVQSGRVNWDRMVRVVGGTA